MQNYKIKCTCQRGYLATFVQNEAGVPIGFTVHKGYLIIRGHCDACGALLNFTVTLADLLTEEAPNWTSAKTRRVE